jgi:hypothetical protein
MTSKAWSLSPHAIIRLVDRFGLLVDKEIESEISTTLDSVRAKLIRINYGRTMYEIQVLGVPMIVVVQSDERVIVTFMDSKKWHRKENRRSRRHDNFRPKESKESTEEE